MSGKQRSRTWSVACAALLVCASWSWAQGCGNGGCGTGCNTSAGVSCGRERCPGPFKWFYEGGPKIHFKAACPRPVCDPCTLPHYGYYATCWSPWPFAQDWSHCPTPPPGEMLPPPAYPPYSPKLPAATGQYLPTYPTANELPAPGKNNNAPAKANTNRPSVRLLP